MKRLSTLIQRGAAGLLALAAVAAAPVTQAQTPPTAPAAPAAGASRVQVLVAHPVVHALAQRLTAGSAIGVVRAAPASLPPARQVAFFEGRGAQALAQAAAGASAVIGIRSLWPQDPLYPLARRANIRVIEIDAVRPVDGALPGIALQPGADLNSYPWLHPVNLGRMADIVAADLERLAPGDAPVLARNLAALRQRLVTLSGQTETSLLAAPNLTVVSLSPRLDYLAAAFNLERVPAPADAGDLAALIRREGLAAVLHHEALPDDVARAAAEAGANVVVLVTGGEDPVADLEVNAARLVQVLVKSPR